MKSKKRPPKLQMPSEERLLSQKHLEEFEKSKKWLGKEPVMVYKAGYQARLETCLYLLHSKRGYPFWVATFNNLFYDLEEKKWSNRATYSIKELYVLKGLIDRAISFITKRDLANPYFLAEHGSEAIRGLQEARAKPRWSQADNPVMPDSEVRPAEQYESKFDQVESFVRDLEKSFDDEFPTDKFSLEDCDPLLEGPERSQDGE